MLKVAVVIKYNWAEPGGNSRVLNIPLRVKLDFFSSTVIRWF